MIGTWREHAAPIIDRVLDETAGKSLTEIRKALRLAYPYGERKMYPYKIWCDEINKQLKSRRLITASPKREQMPLFGKD